MSVKQPELLLTVNEVGAGVHVDADGFRNLRAEALQIMIEDGVGHRQQFAGPNTTLKTGHGGLARQRTIVEVASGSGAKDEVVTKVITIVSVEGSADDLVDALAKELLDAVNHPDASVVDAVGKRRDERTANAGAGHCGDSGVACQLGLVKVYKPIAATK